MLPPTHFLYCLVCKWYIGHSDHDTLACELCYFRHMFHWISWQRKLGTNGIEFFFKIKQSAFFPNYDFFATLCPCCVVNSSRSEAKLSWSKYTLPLLTNFFNSCSNLRISLWPSLIYSFYTYISFKISTFSNASSIFFFQADSMMIMINLM